MTDSWTAERVRVLLTALVAGTSPSRIAAILGGGVTREDVVQKSREVAEIAARQPPAPLADVRPRQPNVLPRRKASPDSTLRRFDHAEIDPSQARDLRADHPALADARTIFPGTVVSAMESPRLLVSGHNNPKLGADVRRGPREGWPIFHVTLEERATCPRSCAQWAGCYGNAMHRARRHAVDEHLIPLLRSEVMTVARQHPDGLLVRLHTLGDFFSVDYVRMWGELLAFLPQLHVFGYTARRVDDADQASAEIAAAIEFLADDMWERFSIRTSHPEFGPQRSVVVHEDPRREDVIVCPAQINATQACATCGLCWETNARGKTIAFLKHGMRRQTGPRAAAAPAPVRAPAPAAPAPPAPLAASAASGDWTDEQTAKLKKLRGEGLSFSQIGKQIGKSRNACIAKANRLGMSEGQKSTRVRTSSPGSIIRPTNPSPAPRLHARIPFSPTPRPDLKLVEPEPAFTPDGRLNGAPTPLMIPLAHLSEHTCKWPIGSPGEEGFGFCGNRTAAGRPYCGFHCAKAYEPPKKHSRPKDYERSLRRHFA